MTVEVVPDIRSKGLGRWIPIVSSFSEGLERNPLQLTPQGPNQLGWQDLPLLGNAFELTCIQVREKSGWVGGNLVSDDPSDLILAQ